MLNNPFSNNSNWGNSETTSNNTNNQYNPNIKQPQYTTYNKYQQPQDIQMDPWTDYNMERTPNRQPYYNNNNLPNNTLFEQNNTNHNNTQYNPNQMELNNNTQNIQRNFVDYNNSNQFIQNEVSIDYNPKNSSLNLNGDQSDQRSILALRVQQIAQKQNNGGQLHQSEVTLMEEYFDQLAKSPPHMELIPYNGEVNFEYFEVLLNQLKKVKQKLNLNNQAINWYIQQLDQIQQEINKINQYQFQPNGYIYKNQLEQQTGQKVQFYNSILDKY